MQGLEISSIIVQVRGGELAVPDEPVSAGDRLHPAGIEEVLAEKAKGRKNILKGLSYLCNNV